ncbi:unnamed protein product [Pleuronectes platessa]|uniref:Uncharacterized protein n=1 Tax=Pleuronectes platessa TaxID=8262 RepID=A0A9N7YIK4_PLEPL|nr:unnamed protein product [Pleuronectes platessa]
MELQPQTFSERGKLHPTITASSENGECVHIAPFTVTHTQKKEGGAQKGQRGDEDGHPSVSLALASESSLMPFSKLCSWAEPTKLSPLQLREMKVHGEGNGRRGKVGSCTSGHLLNAETSTLAGNHPSFAVLIGGILKLSQMVDSGMDLKSTKSQKNFVMGTNLVTCHVQPLQLSQGHAIIYKTPSQRHNVCASPDLPVIRFP